MTVDFYVTSPSNLVNGKLQGCSSNCKYPPGGITDSDIILNPAFTFSTTGTAGSSDLQAVLTHELGHALSANHTGLLGGAMYPYVNGIVPRYLSTDDLAFVNSVYPATAAPPSFGIISGKITSSAGAGISYGLITMIDASGGSTVGGLTNSDGTFAVQVPPGTYIVYAEPYNSYLQLGPGNFYLNSGQAAMVSTFQSTMYGGVASPTQVAVNANGTATVNITVTAGTSPVQMQFYGLGGAGNSGDVLNFTGVGGPIQTPSGASVKTVDLVFIGPGLDATLTDANFHVYGQGVSVHPGTVRVDKSVISPSGPLMRVTLDIPARQTETLASIFISTAAGTSSLSGILTVTPPTPTFVSAGVISAAPYTGIPSGVSPGGIYSIYDIPNTPNLGPSAFVQNAPSYDAYGNIATTLAGVTVTFDGVPAPMFLSWGNQLNFQVPYEVAGQTSTQVVVNYLGSASSPVTVPVRAVQPGFFTADGKAVSAYNLPSYTVNTAQNPAPAGSYVEVYGTGVGKLSNTLVTGHGANTPSFAGSYTYSIGGSPTAPASFGGLTSGSVGLAQWDVQIPSGIASGAVSIVVTDASGATSQPGVTIFVK